MIILVFVLAVVKKKYKNMSHLSDIAVKSYTDKQLLDRVRSLPSYQYIPKGYWFCFVRSNEDRPDVFDDKCYLFKGEKFIEVTSCTTNPGLKGLRNYQNYNPKGTFVAKSDQWNMKVWKMGLHRGKMIALRQVRKMFGFRDRNRNNKSEENGVVDCGLFGINFHCIDYKLRRGYWRRFIGGWSVGCFVLNHVDTYKRFFNLFKSAGQSEFSFCLLKEF